MKIAEMQVHILEAEKTALHYKALYYQTLMDLRAAHRGAVRLRRRFERAKHELDMIHATDRYNTVVLTNGDGKRSNGDANTKQQHAV